MYLLLSWCHSVVLLVTHDGVAFGVLPQPIFVLPTTIDLRSSLMLSLPFPVPQCAVEACTITTSRLVPYPTATDTFRKRHLV